MQTFLPFPDFKNSVAVLDKKRAWKQVVEASQILDILLDRKTKPVKYNKDGSIRQRGHSNHPAVLAWQGYESSLQNYFDVFLDYCINIHKINTKYKYELPKTIVYPFWIDCPAVYESHKDRLAQKAFEDLGKGRNELYLSLLHYNIIPEKRNLTNDYIWPVTKNGINPVVKEWLRSKNESIP